MEQVDNSRFQAQQQPVTKLETPLQTILVETIDAFHKNEFNPVFLKNVRW